MKSTSHMCRRMQRIEEKQCRRNRPKADAKVCFILPKQRLLFLLLQKSLIQVKTLLCMLLVNISPLSVKKAILSDRSTLKDTKRESSKPTHV